MIVLDDPRTFTTGQNSASNSADSEPLIPLRTRQVSKVPADIVRMTAFISTPDGHTSLGSCIFGEYEEINNASVI